MAQGGDPTGDGEGGPGYKLKDEISDLGHVPGSLAYANSGPDTNGSQFYVTETAQPELDGKYTVFGLCTPVSVVSALTHVEKNDKDKPRKDVHIKTITITRSAP
jgi:peptidyl-prolyl cis-trans isomerase A (cyclophilin A)